MAPERLAGGGRGTDWAGSLNRTVDRQHEDADREAMIAWREFKDKFRNGDFDVEVPIGDKRYRYADWHAIDQIVRR